MQVFTKARRVSLVASFALLAPFSQGLAQEDSAAEANRLFIQAVTLYRASQQASEEEKASAYAKVQETFDRILKDFPNSRPAKAIQAGGQPGGVDLAALPGFAANASVEILMACDKLASHPLDHLNPKDIKAKWDSQLSPSADAIKSCEEALKAAPKEQAGRYAFLLARLHRKLEQNKDQGRPPEAFQYVKYLRQSKDSKYPMGLYWWGRLHHDGNFGVRQSYATAWSFYARAAALGSTSAIGEQGYMFAQGQGRSKDASQAITYFSRAHKLSKEQSIPSIGGNYLCWHYFNVHAFGPAKNWCQQSRNDFSSANTRAGHLEDGYTYAFKQCGTTNRQRSEIELILHKEDQYHLQRNANHFGKITWDLVDKTCKSQGDRIATVKYKGETLYTFSTLRFQPKRPNGWFNSRNLAKTAYDAALQRKREAERRERERQARLRQERLAREQAQKTANQIANMKASLSQQHSTKMRQLLAGTGTISNVDDVLRFNKPRALITMVDGTTLLLRVRDISLREGVVFVNDRHIGTDPLRAVRDFERTNLNAMRRWLNYRSILGRRPEQSVTRVVCRMSSRELAGLEGRGTAVFDAKLKTYDNGNAVFDCKLR
ncbi:MAG: hypothetical protein AAGD04_09015 [Pseudomonadota bacterium]